MRLQTSVRGRLTGIRHKSHSALAMADSLIQSAFGGDGAAVEAQLAGAALDLNSSAGQGFAAIIGAASNGHLEIVRQLVTAGADVNVGRDEDGATAIVMAAQNGHAAVVQFLVDSGANANAVTEQQATALWLAAQNGHAAVVGPLVDGGAEIDGPGRGGTSALFMAVQGSHADAVRILCERGANVTPEILMLASAVGNPGVSDLLEPGRLVVIARVVEITQASEEAARAALMGSGWQLQQAILECLDAAAALEAAPAQIGAVQPAQVAGEAGGGAIPPAEAVPPGVPTFGRSNFIGAYDIARPPRGPLELGHELGELIRGFCERNGIPFRNAMADWEADVRPIRTGQNFLLELQREVMEQPHAGDELATEAGIRSAAQRLWTSALRLSSAANPDGTELCSMINATVRQDDEGDRIVPLARLCRAINLNNAAHVVGLPPQDNMCWRGTGWREEHRGFFTQRTHFRHRMFLATSYLREKAEEFIRRCDDDHKVLWLIHVRAASLKTQTGPVCLVRRMSN